MNKNFLWMNIVLIACVNVVFVSCANEEELNVPKIKQSPRVEVSKMSEWRHATRSGMEDDGMGDMPVLHFRDELAYEEILEQLHDMTVEEKMEFFEELGFEGAFTYMRAADEELDEIFDIEDDDEFLAAYEEYKEKHDGVLEFNGEEENDLTPSFTFTDLVLWSHNLCV